jgi:hypothetical protein
VKRVLIRICVNQNGVIVEPGMIFAVMDVSRDPVTVAVVVVPSSSQMKISLVHSIPSMMKREPIDYRVLEIQVGHHQTTMKLLFFLLMFFMKLMVSKHSENIVVQVSIHKKKQVDQFLLNNCDDWIEFNSNLV